MAKVSTVHTMAAATHRAVLWLMANIITFRTPKQRDLMLQDFIDFLQRTRWKLYQKARRKACAGNLLITIDTNTAHIRLRNEWEEDYVTRAVLFGLSDSFSPSAEVFCL
jgi:hypothetical protein